MQYLIQLGAFVVVRLTYFFTFLLLDETANPGGRIYHTSPDYPRNYDPSRILVKLGDDYFLKIQDCYGV